MKRLVSVVLLVMIGVVPALAVPPDHIHYGKQLLSGKVDIRSFSDKWDLTQCDLEITYGVELTLYQPSHFGGSELVMVGLENVGGLAMTSVNLFTQDPNVFDRDDLFVLTQSPYDPFNYLAYDALTPNTIVPAFGTNETYAFWFDRTLAGAIYPTRWGSINGANYNTQGKYWLKIVFHAISPTQGTMFATINGLQQGFYTSAGPKLTPPNFYPAGRSITGDLTNVNVWAVLGTVDGGNYGAWIKELDVVGCLARQVTPVRNNDVQAIESRSEAKPKAKGSFGVRGR